MAWVKIDDHFDEHPKLAKVGPIGWGVWLAGLAYSNRNRTDGFIPHAIAEGIGGRWRVRRPGADGIEEVWRLGLSCGDNDEDLDSDFVAALLVEAELWETVDGGYQIHDYADYQPTREDADDLSAKRAEAGSRGGRAKRKQTDSKLLSNMDAKADQVAGKSEAKDKHRDPVPVPDPDPDPDPVPPNGGSPPSTVDPHDIQAVMDHWNARWVPSPWKRPLRLTDKRRTHIRARLRTFRLDDLCQAIDLLRESPFHAGQNDRGWVADPEYLFRSDDQVEKVLLRARPPGPPTRASPTAPDPERYRDVSWEDLMPDG